MDSMRSLNSSLPPSRSSGSTPPDLLQAFRTAALSVTTLYKSAAADQANSRQAGYQDALEDLLKLLDEENLGLQDGEGWRIRQWATQRYDGGSYQQYADEEEETEHDIRQPTSSPTSVVPRETVDVDDRNQQDEQEEDVSNDHTSPQSPTVFQFTGAGDYEPQMHAEVSSSSSSSSSSQPIDETRSCSPSIRLEVLNRSKSTSRNSNGRHSSRATPREFTFTAGTKRKLHFPDFFDISNIPDRRDAIGGSKRGRLS